MTMARNPLVCCQSGNVRPLLANNWGKMPRLAPVENIHSKTIPATTKEMTRGRKNIVRKNVLERLEHGEIGEVPGAVGHDRSFAAVPSARVVALTRGRERIGRSSSPLPRRY